METVDALSLWNTQVSDVGLKEVAKMNKLKELRLGAITGGGTSGITGEGMKELAKLQQLERLSLFYVSITDAGIKEVAKMKQLTYLDWTAPN